MFAIYVWSLLSVQFGSILSVSVTHRNCLICRANQDGDPVSDGDINAPGNELFEGQYFVLTDKSAPINFLLATLFDLIICGSTKIN